MAVIQTQTEIARLGFDLNGVMTLVARRSQEITGANGAVVEIAEGDDMVYRAVAGSASGQLGLRLPRKTSLSGLCVSCAQPLHSDDTEIDVRVNREACRRVGLRSMIVVPLIHNGGAIGALKVLSPEPFGFGDGDLKVLGLMSEVIAAAMYHAVKYGADELFKLATRDSLSGLANRSLFYDRLRHGIATAKRESRRVGVLMIDMDGLKPINDQYGHKAGDAAIKEIARRLANATRQSDTVARLGGDEFGIVLTEIEDRESARIAALRIAEKCDGSMMFEGKPMAIGISLGTAIFPDDGDQPDTLLERADRLMYDSKRERKLSGVVPAALLRRSPAGVH